MCRKPCLKTLHSIPSSRRCSALQALLPLLTPHQSMGTALLHGSTPCLTEPRLGIGLQVRETWLSSTAPHLQPLQKPNPTHVSFPTAVFTSVTFKKPEKSATTFPCVSIAPLGFPAKKNRGRA